PGFYIDVGAHHPFRFSNTKLLYDMGWNGINIDANPGVAPLFKSHRSRDVFINKGISQKIQILEYFKYTHSALNTFEKKVVDSRMKKPVSSEPIEVQPLAEILNNTVQLNQKIDLMSIDTE